MAEKIIVGGPKYEDPEQSWFDAEDTKDVARLLFDSVKAIEQKQASINQGHQRHANIYAGYTPVGLSWGGPTLPVRPPVQATRNIIRSVCDTATALISKAWPRPRIVTDGADWDVQRRASQLDKFLVGVYRRAKVYAQAQLSFRDSTIFGTGAYVLRECGKGKDYYIEAERVLPSDLIIDEEACPNQTEPSDWYLRKVLPIKHAIRKYAKGDDAKIKAIKAAAGKQPLSWPGGMHVPVNKVVILEAWHIGYEESPGRHVTTCEGAVLETESWAFDWAPIVVLYWSPPVSGFYGDGVAYRQYGRQTRINYLYRWVQRCQDLIAVPRVWVDAVNGPLKIQISNEIGEIVGYRGPKPEFQTPQAVGAEIYNWIDKLEGGGFADEGMDEASSQGTIPKGVESAPAQRELTFKQGTRFAPVSQRWENSVAQETTTKMMAMYKAHFEAFTSEGSPKTTWSNRKLVEEIEWADVDLETEQYEIRIEASSLEDLSPAGRIQAVIELAQTGWIEPNEGRRLLGHPDLERQDKVDTAAEEYNDYVASKLKSGVYIMPNINGDLEGQQSVVRAELLQAEMGGAENTRDGKKAMALMRQFLVDVDSKLNPNPENLPVGAGGLTPAQPPVDPTTGMPAGVANSPAPAMSLPAAQGLAPMADMGQSRQGF